MHRRGFLKTLGLASASTLLWSYRNTLTLPARGKVIVIGAGMSGIAAARELKSQGWEVVVLEARNRTGGRVWSDKSMGMTFDMGASWIHGGTNNPMKKLADEFNIQYKQTDYDSLHLYDHDGYHFTDEELEEVWSETQSIIKRSMRWCNKQDKDVSVQAGLDAILQNETLNEKQQRLLNWRICTEELNAAIEFSELSAWGDTERGTGEDYLFPDGYGQILWKLAEGLDVKLEHPVHQITDDGQKVKALTEWGTFEADRLICTIPLGVMKSKSVIFDPKLPESKWQAFDQLGMGVLNKIGLKFHKTFWPTDRDMICLAANEKGEFPVFINMAYYSGNPGLLATLTNSYSRPLELRSNDEIRNMVFNVLSRTFKDALPPDQLLFSRWANDPYSYGSYSYMKVGARGEAYEELAKEHGRIHFAGEHTMRYYPATVHGAYMSGLREAEKIIAL